MSRDKNDLSREIDAILQGKTSDNRSCKSNLQSEIDAYLGSNNNDSLISICNENASLIDREVYSNQKKENKDDPQKKKK